MVCWETDAEDGVATKEKRGRPKRRFIDVAKEDMIGVEVTEDDTEDRKYWKWKIRSGDPSWEKTKGEEEEEEEEEEHSPSPKLTL